MASIFKKVAEVEAPEAPFVPDGQVMPDGSVRYKVLGGDDPSGVYWVKIVPPGGDLRAAQAERDAAVARLRG